MLTDIDIDIDISRLDIGWRTAKTRAKNWTGATHRRISPIFPHAVPLIGPVHHHKTADPYSDTKRRGCVWL